MNDLVFLGRQGESGVRTISFDIAEELRGQYNNVNLRVRRPSEFSYYQPETTVQDGKIIWPIKSADTTNAGHGEVQLVAENGIAFGPIHPTVVLRSLTIREEEQMRKIYKHFIFFKGEYSDGVNTENIQAAVSVILGTNDEINAENIMSYLIVDEVLPAVGSVYVSGAGISMTIYAAMIEGNELVLGYFGDNGTGTFNFDHFEITELTDTITEI